MWPLTGAQFDFNGGGSGDERIGGGASDSNHANLFCTTDPPDVDHRTWSISPGHTNHYGFSTYGSAAGTQCHASDNWNYCENGFTYKGGYNNGSPMDMDIFVGGTCKPAKGAGDSCQAVLDSGAAAGDGYYTIGLAGGTDVLCKFEGSVGWTQVVDVRSHNRQHCTDRANEQKLSDSTINQLLGSCGALRAAQSSPRTQVRFFRKTGGQPFDFNGGGSGDLRIGGGAGDSNHSGTQCSTTFPDTSWGSAEAVPSHYGFSTHRAQGSCAVLTTHGHEVPMPDNWNYCENDGAYLGAYDNGQPSAMTVWATSSCH